MTSRRRRRKDRVWLKNVLGVVILSLAAVVMGVLVWFWIMGAQSVGADLCPKGGPQSITVIAVDATDVLDEVQRLSLVNELTRIVDTIPRSGAVQVWEVAPSEAAVPDSKGAPVCNPGNVANPWFENPAFVEQRYREQFRNPLLKKLEGLVSGESAPQSPIMESVQAIALRTFDRPEYKEVVDKRLVLASDLIQNTATHSQLHALVPFDQFSGTLPHKKVAPRLQDVRVELLYIQRPVAPSFRRHIEFWQRYFAAAGATLDHVVPVAGVSNQSERKS